ncbi:hypothetical protein HU755_21865 [Pseudomonas sp. SWRI111]|uniref:hypothetical protein n=1 Tax=Pseudomonas sp. SWRI111 TaxID=2745507 RepID=UPI001644C4D5|nr:hypothetical protein [Pseudomonas sp. SWRI111]MBC3209456.1 hypothetical protein [Pseudomonas sp. SWRI111]
MKLANLLFSCALMTAIGAQPSFTYAAEVRSGGRAEGDRDASAPLLQNTLHKAREQSIAADGSDRTPQNRVAEGGADRLHERQLAADGANHLKQNRIAEGGSDRLLERRVADNGNSTAYRAVPGFCMACR